MSENRFKDQQGAKDPAASLLNTEQAIAIIGMGLRFPYDIKDEVGMWKALLSGKSAIRNVPEDRWPTDVFQHPSRSEPGRSVTFAAGILEESHLFDASFFNISPREAAWMDPQQRLLLEMTQEAFDDAGLPDREYRGSDCGVYIGMSGMDYGQNALIDLASISAHTMTGNTLSIAANRISYIFDLHGPSMAIDTACSSSLAAVHEACQALKSGAIPMALAGGINMLMHPYPFIGFSHASMLSASGQCRPFDSAGDGYVRGEGGAVLVLKPLTAALTAGDRIHAVIIGSGVNSDGAGKKGLTIPSAVAQTELMSKVLEKSGLDAEAISYVEAHGTGTPVGDPAEAESIGRAYGRYRSQPLPISSAKANFGHLEPASGMAGLIKAILVLKHGQIPPMPFKFEPNPDINFKELNIYCAAEGASLKAGEERPLIGAVNSFGFGGLNAHILLRESPQVEIPSTRMSEFRTPPPLVISAKTQTSLAQLAARYADLLEELPQEKYTDLAWNVVYRRSFMEKRLAVLADNAQERIKALRDFSQGLSSRQINTETALPSPGRIAFVYSGNGAQWHGMGRQLYQESSAFAKMLNLLDKEMMKLSGWSIIEVLFNAPEETFQDTTISQPLLFAIQVALTSLFEEMGIIAEATCGHSVGEIAAVWAAGALSLDEALRIIYIRSTAQGKTRGMGRMAAAGLGAEDAEKELSALGLSERIEIAAVNSPHNCTLSGDGEALEELGKTLAEKGVFFRMLDLDYAFHSRHMDKVRTFMEEGLRGLAPSSIPKALFISTVNSQNATPPKLDSAYWWENMRNPVNFGSAIEKLANLGINIFIEIGPHAILQRYIRDNLPAGAQARVLPSLQQSSAGLERIRSTAASAYLLAPKSTLPSLFSGKASWMPLPAYPWEQQRFSFPITVERTPIPTRTRPLLGWPLASAHPTWEIILDPLKDSWLADHHVGESIVFPAAAYVEMALEAATQWLEGKAIKLESFDILLPLLFENNKSQTLRCEINANDGSFSIQSRPRLENEPWLIHAKGRIVSLHKALSKPEMTPLGDNAARMLGEELYELTKNLGLDYGPFFRRISSLAVHDNRIDAILKDSPEEGYVINPGVLDACFHSLAAIYTNTENAAAYLPVGFSDLGIFSTHTVTLLKANLVKSSKRTLHANFELLDTDGNLVARITDCRFRKLPLPSKSQTIDSWLYRKVLQTLPIRGNASLRDPATALQELWNEYKLNPARKLWFQEILPRLEASVGAGIITLFNQYGSDLQDNFPSAFTDWMRQIFHLSENVANGETPDWMEIWQEAHNLAPNLLTALLPMARLMRHLFNAAAGQEKFGTISLERGTIAQEHSTLNPAYSGIDQLLEKFLDKLIPPGKTINLLEASSYPLMPDSALSTRIEKGQAHLQLLLPDNSSTPQLPLGNAKCHIVSDPLQWLESQDTKNAYDIIILRQLLHDSSDLKRTLQALRDSLKPGGILLLTERNPDWSADLSSGLNEKWWRRDAEGKIHSSRMNAESWLALLEDSVFEDCGIILEPEAEGLAEGSYLIYGRKKQSAQKELSSQTLSGSWLILHDKTEHQLALRLSERLEEMGCKVRSENLSFVRQSQAENRIFIYGRQLSPEIATDLLADLNINLLQASPSDKTWIVTRSGGEPGADSGALVSDLIQAAIGGYLRVLHSEKPRLNVRLRDLAAHLDTNEAADCLLKEIIHDTEEDEAYLSSAGRHIFSLSKAHPPLEQLAEKVRLDIPQPGRLDNLTWVSDEPTSLNDDDVQARVMATGLNFRDIMLAMGLLPEDALENGFAGPNLGLEFSGIVTAAGKNIANFAPGDRVAGFASACFASHVQMPEISLTHIPDDLDYAAAAAIPTIFITAWYALKHQAQLQKGEKLLVHGAAGGVGLAAIQIGRLLGAEVFATAGTDEKRDYLRLLGINHIFDSRSLAFADEILSATNGQGVDVVLNSLAGEAMRRSVSLLKPFGRFLELGKRDYVENTSIGLRPFKENISYFSIDVDQLLTARPDLANTLFEEVMAHLRSGDLTPPPWRVFDSAHIQEAFRTMQQARHMGKVVVDMQELPAISTPLDKLRSDYSGTWLISGGLAGFGLETARHLAHNGADNLVLASRRGANVPEADSIREEFAALGTKVFLKSCDFSQKNEVDELVQWIEENLTPLTGIVHAAAVFDDRKLEKLDRDSFARSLYPKMLGALYLHESTRRLPLKYFLLFSSISVALGNPGQANYVAANAALEALTLLRNAQGLPASCLAWGPIGDSGYLSRNEAVQKNLALQLGRPTLSSKEAMGAFDIYAAKNGVHILANVNWSRALEFAEKIPVRLMEVHSLCSEESDISLSSNFASLLLEMDEREALDNLEQIIVRETAKVLGMDAASTPHDRSLQALGLDSLMAMELAVSLEQATGLHLPPMLLQDAPTVEQLARRLWERLGKSANEDITDKSLLEDLARRHSEKLNSDDIKNVLKNIDSEKE